MRHLSARVKILQILVPILKQDNFSSNFASFFIVMIHNASVNFKLINVLFWTKESHQSPNFEIFECSGKNLPNPSCYFPNHKSVFLQVLHHSSVSWNITPLYLLSANISYFVQKEPIKGQIFGTFECLCQNSSNSSCQFWNNKSVPLQTLHQFLFSWHITPL